MPFTKIKGSRWIIIAVIVVAAYLFLHRGQVGSNTHGWDVFGISGQYLTQGQRSVVRSTAPFLGPIPKEIAGLPFAGAIVHPQGLNAIAFVELLYGSPQGQFVDIAESQNELAATGVKGRITVSGKSVQVGVAKFAGHRRAFALWHTKSLWMIVVASTASPDWSSLIGALLP